MGGGAAGRAAGKLVSTFGAPYMLLRGQRVLSMRKGRCKHI